MNPVAGGVHALVLLPKSAQHFDEETAGAASGVGHADFGQLRHELFGAGKIAFLAADGIADFIHKFSGQRVDQGLGHRAGDAGGGVIDALVFAVGREKHFVTFAENVLVNAPVVVVDDAAAESLVPIVDAEHEIELVAKKLEIGRVCVQPLPNSRRKNFRVVVFVEEILEEFEELGHDAVGALWLPEPGEAGVFILREAVLHQAVILNRAGKNKLVDEQNDGFGGLFGRRPLDLVELVEPDVQVFKKLVFQFGLFRRVLNAAQGVEDAAGLAAACEEIGKRQIGERFAVKEIIARVEKPGRAKVGQDQVFVVAQIFFNLGGVMLWVGVVAPQGIGAVALKERLEFQGDRLPLRLGQHEINPSLAEANLARGLETKNVLAEFGEKVFRGGFGFDGVFQVQDILANGRVIGNRPFLRRRRQEFNTFARSELAQRIQDVSINHGQVV